MKMNDSLLQPAPWKTAAVFLLVTCFCAAGQETDDGDFISGPATVSPVLTNRTDVNVLKAPEIKKVSFSLSTGMALETAGKSNYFTMAYIAPAIAYKLSPRFRVRAGSIIYFNSFYNPSEGSSQPGILSARPLNQVALFFAADYFLTERIRLTGTYYKYPDNALYRQEVRSEVYNRNAANYYVPAESMSLGLNYKISNGFSVGAEFRISNHYQPVMSPYPYTPASFPYAPDYW